MEFTWLVSCSTVNDHYSFLCLKAMFFAFLHELGAVEQALLS